MFVAMPAVSHQAYRRTLRVGDGLGFAQARTQLGSGNTVAFEAERLNVREVAFPAAFGDRHDVVCVPERFAFAEFPFA